MVSRLLVSSTTVGGGSAGAVLSKRLSVAHRVLLLEAGGLEDTVTDVPLFAVTNQHTDIDWNLPTEPQKNCAYALRDQACNEMFTT